MKPVKRIFPVLLTLVLITPLLSGCWDRLELEERTSVVAMAIDRVVNEENQQPLIKISVQIPIPIKIVGSGGGGEGGKNAVKVMSATGFSLLDAMRNLQNRLNQQLFYGHTRVLAVSEDVAREDMAGIVDSLRRNPQMRRLLWLVVTPGQASQLLQADPKLEQIPIVYVMDLIENGAKSGRIPDLTLGKWYMNRSSAGREPSANYVKPTSNDVKWYGLALFQDDHMVGHLAEKETDVLLQVRDEQIGADITVPCPTSVQAHGQGVKKFVTAHPKKIHSKTNIDKKGDSFRMHSEVLIEVDIAESNCELDYTVEKTNRVIERAIRDEMNRRAAKLIEDVQKKFKSDVFGMGEKVRSKYYAEYQKIKWNEVFPTTTIEINYSVKIRRVGMKMK